MTLPKHYASSRGKQLKQWILAAAIAVLAWKTVLAVNRVPSGSMLPTLQAGDSIFLNRLAYRFGTPTHGDVIVFSAPGTGQRLVKRVMAVEGDRVAVLENVVYLNGLPLSYLPHPADPRIVTEATGAHAHRIIRGEGTPAPDFPEIVVPIGHVFVLGDNRDNSVDSRRYGPVPVANVLGSAPMVFMSREGASLHWQRFFSAVK